MSTVASADVHVVLNGQSLFDGTILGPSEIRSYTKSLSLLSGDRLDFVVGDGGTQPDLGTKDNDTMGLSATVSTVPEPSTLVIWSLLGGASASSSAVGDGGRPLSPIPGYQTTEAHVESGVGFSCAVRQPCLGSIVRCSHPETGEPICSQEPQGGLCSAPACTLPSTIRSVWTSSSATGGSGSRTPPSVSTDSRSICIRPSIGTTAAGMRWLECLDGWRDGPEVKYTTGHQMDYYLECRGDESAERVRAKLKELGLEWEPWGPQPEQ